MSNKTIVLSEVIAVQRWVWIVVAIALLTWVVHKVKQNLLILQVKKELKKLQQAGEPTKLPDLLPPIPASQDGGPLYRRAIAQLELAKKKLPQPVWNNIYEFSSRRPSKPFNPADVQKVLNEVQPALQTLRKALNYPHMRMVNWDFENPMNILLPHLSWFREFARLLVVEGKWRKRQGDIDGAIESHLAGLKLARRMGDEPILITFYAQGVIFTLTFFGLREILSDAEASPKSYQALLVELQAQDIDRSFVRAIQSERAATIASCDWIRKTPNRHLSDKGIIIWLGGKNTLIAHNELKLLEYYEAMINIARKGTPYDRKEIDRLEKRWPLDTGYLEMLGGKVVLVWGSFIAKWFMMDISHIFNKAALYHALQRVAQVAIALRLYRQEHRRYPETLQELVPKYLPHLPIDPYDGKPLRYKRLMNGFKVWSVGYNLKDEGGVEKQQWWQEGDIVWEAKM